MARAEEVVAQCIAEYATIVEQRIHSRTLIDEDTISTYKKAIEFASNLWKARAIMDSSLVSFSCYLILI